MDLARLATGSLHHPAAAPAPVRFAAEQLASYLARIFGRGPVLRPCDGDAGSWLRLDTGAAPPPAVPDGPPAGAESIVEPAGERLVLAATSPRALLAAAYGLLEAAGCRWSPRGAAEEHVPRPSEVRPIGGAIVTRPAFARRAWASDLATWHYTMPERLAERLPADIAFVDWMAKSGATGLLFIRHANDTQWLVPELVPELTRRGLEVEVGGHAMVELLPRELYGQHPDYFPTAADGQRSDLGNVCASSTAALAIVRERAQRAPGGDLHLWPLDLGGGGWCHCGGCAGLTPSDQALRVCNHAAEGTGGRTFHLAYHDTLAPPPAVRPLPSVWAEFAPRERCYAHALDEPACATNLPYRRALEAHLALFDGRVQVFEYYADAILFGGCAVPLVEVLGRDLEYYRRAGVPGVSCLVFGRYSLWAYAPNVEAFAAAAMGRDAAAAVSAHCARRWGGGAGAMARYLAALERLMAGVVTYGDVQLPPREPARAAAVHQALGRALEEAPRLRSLLAEAEAGASPEALLAAETHLVDYTLEVIAAARAWLGARLATTPDRQATERAVAALGGAIAHVHAVDPAITGTWGVHDLPLAHAFFAASLRAATAAAAGG